jgi:N-acyl-L-homoserine lactone synthetase
VSLLQKVAPQRPHAHEVSRYRVVTDKKEEAAIQIVLHAARSVATSKSNKVSIFIIWI